jgi:hypothetical protein
MGLRVFLCLGLIVAAVAGAFAQGGPPLLTDDPGTPGPNNWEINIAHTSDLRAGEHSYEGPLLDINYGVGPRIQLKYEVPYVWQSSDGRPLQSGLGNSLAGVKWRFYQDGDRKFNISTYPQLEFNNPTHSVRRGLADPGTRFLLPLEITKEFGPLELNGEAGLWLGGSGVEGKLLGLAAGHQWSKSFEGLAELYRLTDDKGADFVTAFNLGGRYEFHPGLLFIFAAGRGFGGSDQPHFMGYFGLQIQIEHKAR